MMELEPCPFCGGKPYFYHDYSSESGDWYTIDCLNENCPMFHQRGAWDTVNVTTGWRKTEDEAVKAWNTRWERTCNLIPTPYREYTSGYEYKCSVCGFLMTDHDSYCSECGARRV